MENPNLSALLVGHDPEQVLSEVLKTVVRPALGLSPEAQALPDTPHPPAPKGVEVYALADGAGYFNLHRNTVQPDDTLRPRRQGEVVGVTTGSACYLADRSEWFVEVDVRHPNPQNGWWTSPAWVSENQISTEKPR